MRAKELLDKKMLTSKEFAALFEVVDKCRVCGSEELLKQLMLEVGGMIGSECCMGMFFVKKKSKRVSVVDTMNVGCAEDWAKSYSDRAHSIDSASLLNDTEYFTFWKMSAERMLPWAPSVSSDELKGHTMERGFACGVRDDSAGGISVYLFVRADEKHQTRAEAVLGRVAPHLHAAWDSLLEKKKRTANDKLTAQEKKILESMKDGLNDTDIGNAMGISAHTVRFHVKNIIYKLNAKNRTHALVLAVRKGQLKL
jgi:DNA-binding CsgD family transcriptional regulator